MPRRGTSSRRPSATDFQAIELLINNQWVTIDSWLEYPLTGDAYVLVPAGATIESLEGGRFVVAGGDGKDVRLSHTCNADAKREVLEVSKTATTTYDRAHDWSVAKRVNADEVKLYTNGSGDRSIEYTVDVGYKGYQDSGHTVSGTVTVKNVGQLDATITGVTDTMTLDGVEAAVDLTCPADADGIFSVGETMTCTYSEAVAGAIAGTNDVVVETARNTWAADTVDVTWGAPTNESNKSVTLTDVGDLKGTQQLGTFTAPNGGSKSYTADLAYAAYDTCGTYTYGNTASLSSGQSATANVTVKVQCKVFKGETAWGKGTAYPTADWSMYTAYSPDAPVDLIAGQHYKAGAITFGESGNAKLPVRITVTLADDWSFKAMKENLKVQAYSTAPTKVTTVKPGQFAYKKTCDAASNTCWIDVAAGAYYGIHAEVGRWIPDPKF